MQINFSGQTAVVTGATRGIGLEIAKQLAASGCKVIGTGTDPEGVSRLNNEFTSQKHSIEFRAVDFKDEKSLTDFAKSLSSTAIDILVNNAGINKNNPIQDLDLNDWDAIQLVNLRAPVVLSKEIVPKMMARGYGRVLMVSSVFGHISKAGRLSYSTSKSGILGITRALALDAAPKGVLVNALCPGFINTELTQKMLGEKGIAEMVAQVPMSRLGSVEEIATAACFLVSRENSFMTGQSLIVDGGFSIA